MNRFLKVKPKNFELALENNSRFDSDNKFIFQAFQQNKALLNSKYSFISFNLQK